MSNAIIPGSLSHMAKRNNQSLAESFLSADIIVLLDDSVSMSTPDAPNGMTRKEAAKAELKRLQKQHPGKIALVCFADNVVFCPHGDVQYCGGSTDMVKALQFVKVADDCGLKIILVSDGAPNDERETLKVAATFKSSIQTIYIGREGGSGQDFLNKLAGITGGKSFTSVEPGMLGSGISLLLNG
jgi:hypothetical protein